MKVIDYDSHPQLELPGDSFKSGYISGAPEIPLKREFTIPGLEVQMKSSPNTLWLRPIEAARLEVGDGEPVEAYFEEIPEWQEGREDSIHHTFFGKILLDTDSQSHELSIACKPYWTWFKGAVHEYAAFEHMDEAGFIRSFNPLGIWVNANRQAFLLTHFEEEVTSLDNVDWKHGPDNPLADHIDVFGAFERAAYILGRLHGHGYSHNDAQVKNMASDNQSIRAIDLTTLRRVHSPEEPDILDMEVHIHHDLLAFLSSISIAGYRWGAGEGGERRGQVLRTLFLEYWRSTMRHPSVAIGANYGAQMTQVVDEICHSVSSLSEAEVVDYRHRWDNATAGEARATHGK